MDFYQKNGNDPFAPSITISNILLDNNDSGLLGFTNGLLIDYSAQPKQNMVDNIIDDSEYASYTKINFIVFYEKNDIDNFINVELKNKEFLKTDMQEIATRNNGVIKTVSLSDVSDLSQVSFFDLNSNSLTLFVVPVIDFRSYFVDNEIEDSSVIDSLLDAIYKVETYRYNILIKNETISDAVSAKILNDVRDFKTLNNNILQLLPSKIPTQFSNKQRSYINDFNVSYDRENRIIKNYFSFDILKFIDDNSYLQNITSLSDEEIESTLQESKSLKFTVTKITSDKEEVISEFYSSLSQTEGSSNATCIDKSLYSIEDNFPDTEVQIYYYKIELNFVDPFAKTVYDTSITPNTGLFFEVVEGVQELENFVNDPRNTDAKSGKFETPEELSAAVPSIGNILDKFAKLLNFFVSSEDKINERKKSKLLNSLKYSSSTYALHIEFITIAKKILLQIENIIKNTQPIKKNYIFTSKKAEFKNYSDWFENSLTKENNKSTLTTTFSSRTNNKSTTKSEVTKYNLNNSIIDYTTEVGYKIVNEFIKIKNESFDFSSTSANLISTINEFEGTTIEKIVELQQLNTKKLSSSTLFNKTSITNETATKPGGTVKSSFKQAEISSRTNIESINSTIKNIEITKKIDSNISLPFQMSTQTNMTTESLVPKVQVQLYDVAEQKWFTYDENRASSLQQSKTYLARTNYMKGNDIFTKENIEIPTSNEYFIFTIN